MKFTAVATLAIVLSTSSAVDLQSHQKAAARAHSRRRPSPAQMAQIKSKKFGDNLSADQKA